MTEMFHDARDHHGQLRPSRHVDNTLLCSTIRKSNPNNASILVACLESGLDQFVARVQVLKLSVPTLNMCAMWHGVDSLHHVGHKRRAQTLACLKAPLALVSHKRRHLHDSKCCEAMMLSTGGYRHWLDVRAPSTSPELPRRAKRETRF